MKVNISLAAFPGLRHQNAAMAAIVGAEQGTLTEPLFGQLRADHVQLVPQSMGLLDEAVCDYLTSTFPETSYRLHANVRVLREHRFADLSNFDQHRDWFAQAARIHHALRATAYTAHSGRRADATLEQMLDNARRCADEWGCMVGVEGQYPTPAAEWLVSSWEEYRMLFESGVPYAIDLSHLNILVHRSGRREDGLVAEMLACERAIEVHLSHNNGRGDTHQVCAEPVWWQPLLDSIHPDAVVFSEGNHRRFATVQ
jgi:hypothetical protein